MNYEFHITPAHDSLIRRLNAELEPFEEGSKILCIDNLDEEGYQYERVWMTTDKATLSGGYPSALQYLSNLRNSRGWYKYSGNWVSRMKIECHCSEDPDPEDFLYAEVHFQVTSQEAVEIKTVISRNALSGELIATERCYNPDEFKDFQAKQSSLGRKVEFCLFDDNVTEDKGWLRLPKKIGNSPMSAKMMKVLHNENVRLFKNGCRKIKPVN